MAQTEETQNGSSFQGISLESFLQMLEHERKSCTIDVHSGDVKGSFFFQEGELIDAEYGQQKGIDAAYGLLALKNPVFNWLTQKIWNRESQSFRVNLLLLQTDYQ